MANVLIYASNIIGKSMAGPAIRAWEFAKTLSAFHHVTLVAPNSPTIEGEGFEIITKKDPNYASTFRQAHVLLTQTLTCSMALQAKRQGVKIIIDAYDPVPLETLEQFKNHSMDNRHVQQLSAVNNLNFNFHMADALLCASEKQRDLWIGLLMGQKLITPLHYDQDTSLRHLIDVVPFGLSQTPPKKTGAGIREKYGFAAEDPLLLWGGGIWNWFDPLTLIQAVKRVSLSHPNIKLVFMGIKNPDPSVPEMAMCREAMQLARQLDLLDKIVFFNEGWVPYDERQNFLLDATIGVSTHFDHLETRYSFRTRMLDYIWAQLPILATTGDSFAELIEQHQLGLVVPYQDEHALAQAIVSLITDTDKRARMKINLAQMRTQFYWENVVLPLRRLIDQLTTQPRKTLNYKHLKTIVYYVKTQVKEKGAARSFQILLRKLNLAKAPS